MIGFKTPVFPTQAARKRCGVKEAWKPRHFLGQVVEGVEPEASLLGTLEDAGEGFGGDEVAVSGFGNAMGIEHDDLVVFGSAIERAVKLFIRSIGPSRREVDSFAGQTPLLSDLGRWNEEGILFAESFVGRNAFARPQMPENVQ